MFQLWWEGPHKGRLSLRALREGQGGPKGKVGGRGGRRAAGGRRATGGRTTNKGGNTVTLQFF